ncbi:RNA polymerase sigma factor [Acidobacteriota bacterium]
MMDHQEIMLVEATRKGDRIALAALIDRYGEDLMGYLIFMVHRRAMAEDVFQDVWVKVMEKIRSFRGGSEFAPWLFRIARNRAYDLLRRKREVLHERLEDLPQAATCPDPAEALGRSESVQKVLAGMKDKQREIIYLRFFKELSYDELSKVLRLPMGTVKSRLKRALETFAARYRTMVGEKS